MGKLPAASSNKLAKQRARPPQPEDSEMTLKVEFNMDREELCFLELNGKQICQVPVCRFSLKEHAEYVMRALKRNKRNIENKDIKVDEVYAARDQLLRQWETSGALAPMASAVAASSNTDIDSIFEEPPNLDFFKIGAARNKGEHLVAG